MSARLRYSSLSTSHKELIKKELCIQPAQTHFSKKKFYIPPPDPVNFFLLDKANDAVIVPYIFANYICKTNINFSRVYPSSNYDFTGSLLVDQVPVSEESYKFLTETGTVTLGLYPGFGKTILSAYLIAKLGVPALVMFNRDTLQTQWAETFRKFTTAKVWMVGEEAPPSSFNVILCMDKRLSSLPPVLLELIGCFVVDEAHMFCTQSQVVNLLATQPKYIIICSATLHKKKNGMNKMIYSMAGTHGSFRAMKKPFTVVKFMTGIPIPIKKNKAGDPDWSALSSATSANMLRNEMIVSFVLQNPQAKFIILSWHVNHAIHLKDMLIAKGITADYLAGSKNNYNDSQVLTGTIPKIGTGFDEATACKDFKNRKSDTMILAGSTKDEGGLEQFTGRVFRADMPTIIDFVDDNSIIKNHWKARKKWYLGEGHICDIKVIKMNVLSGDDDAVSGLQRAQQAQLNQLKGLKK